MTPSRRRLERIAFVASARPEAREAMLRMRHLMARSKKAMRMSLWPLGAMD